MTEDEGILLDIDEESFDAAGSKFITFPPGAKVGDMQSRRVEITPDAGWDNVGNSIKFPVVVVEKGPDKGKEDKLSFGIKKDAIWKGKEACAALGVDLNDVFPTVETADGQKRKKLVPSAVIGKQAYGIWTMQEGVKGGIEGGDKVLYPKLTGFSKEPLKAESLGI